MPLYWLPDASCGQISQELSSLLGSFCERWGLPSVDAVDCALESSAESPHREPASDLMAALPHTWRDAVARALFAHPASGSSILHGVLDRIEQELHASLNGKFGLPAGAIAPARVPGHVGLTARLEWLGLRFELRMSCAQMRAAGWLRRPAPVAALARVDLESALARTRVAVVAQIGSVEVSVGELVHLAPGDVLLLTQSLEEPLRISSAGSSLGLRALLGASPVHDSRPPHRALRWLAH